MALLGNLTGSSQFFNPGAFYNGVATQSLRFDQSSSAFLHRTPSGAGNQQIWTFSTWYKLGSTFDSTLNIFSPHTGGDGSNESQMMIDYVNHGGKLRIYDSGATRGDVQTSRVFRDPSAWYNIVISLDLTQGTDTNRVKIYVNGVQETLAGTFPSQNTSWGWNGTSAHRISSYRGGTPFQDGYLSETIMVDGTQLAPTSFGETKNGVWIPIEYTGSYGTNGFRLQFDQTGVGTASASTIGADTSGNTNHYTSSGIVAHDCNMPDSPENNFMTFNPLMRQSQGSDFPVTHEGNLQAHFAGSDQYKYIWSTFDIKPNTGKWYFEVEMQTNMGSTNDIAYIGLGTVGPNFSPTGSNGTVGPTNFYITWRGNTGVRTLYINDAGQSQTTVTVTNMTAGQIWQFAIDTDTGKVWLGLNNSYYAADGGTDGNPSAGTNESGTFSTNTNELSFFGQAQNYNITNVYYTLNAGQDSSFHGNKTAQGNTDANGIGDFYYAPPTGYKALCTANLPEPTIGPNSATQADDHFNTVLYTGNGSPATHTVGFRPNLVWGKRRNVGAQNHWWINDVTDIGKWMASDNNGGEGSEASGTSFNANGSFTTANNDLFINNGSNYVVWAWKGNGTGTAVSNTDGSITSTVSANTTAGFSIVSATSPSSGTWSVGHGLSKKPDMIIQKYRASSSRWTVWHNILTSGQYLGLNESNAIASSGTPFNFNITDSVIGGNANYDATSTAVVYYVFHSVEGYSKIGVYNPNNTTDNAFVHTGFKPAMVILKGAEINNQEWGILDNKRPGYNSVYFLQPQSNTTETTSNIVDFLSNGFKIRETGGVGYLTSNYIYMAFAEAPFKYANAG